MYFIALFAIMFIGDVIKERRKKKKIEQYRRSYYDRKPVYYEMNAIHRANRASSCGQGKNWSGKYNDVW